MGLITCLTFLSSMVLDAHEYDEHAANRSHHTNNRKEALQRGMRRVPEQGMACLATRH